MELHESIEAILRSEKVVAEIFYEIFFERYPEVRVYFEGVDMHRQAVLLTMSLALIANRSIHHYPATTSYLRVLGHQHSARHGIPPDAYPKFRDSLLETLARFHGDSWDDGLSDHWRQAIDDASALMLEGHERPYTA